MAQQFDVEGGHARCIARQGARRGRSDGPAFPRRSAPGRHGCAGAAARRRLFRSERQAAAGGEVELGHAAMAGSPPPRPRSRARIDARAQQGERIADLHDEAAFGRTAELRPARRPGSAPSRAERRPDDRTGFFTAVIAMCAASPAGGGGILGFGGAGSGCRCPRRRCGPSGKDGIDGPPCPSCRSPSCGESASETKV